ncbi:hypothetical protein BaRGS_00013320 [Batillaria attramentaria]|uniref:Uncharacterized protein n=1 Tax=Batillaria attramentaria TaxID=370345 RepID=A0ABD0L806_9CAEN
MLPILLTVVIISVVVNFGLAIALTVTIQRLKKLEQESRTPRDGEVAERLPIQQNGDTNMESGTDERQPLLQDTPDSSQPNVRQEFESLRQVQERSLLQACRENRIQLVNWLVHSGAHVNCSDEKNGETPAHVAARFGYEMLLQFLLCSGADAEARNKKNLTPLHKACKYGREAVVDVLLAAGVDVNAETNNVTPVRLACQHDHTNVLNKLLRAGAIMDADITNNPPHLGQRGIQNKNKPDTNEL